MRTVKILPQQVPQFWDYIKYAAIRANEGLDDIGSYLIGILQDLLAGKLVCFLSISDDREVKNIFVCSVSNENYSNYNVCHIRYIYGFTPATDQEWVGIFEHIIAYAKSNNCKYIYGYTANPRVKELCKIGGFEPIIETLRYTV